MSYVDEETGLEWTRESFGPMTWDEAISFCKELGEGWRLPTIEELITLIDYSRFNPACKIGCESSGYWSSTTDAVNTNGAWRVNFDYGHVNYGGKSNSYYVRAARTAETDWVKCPTCNGNFRRWMSFDECMRECTHPGSYEDCPNCEDGYVSINKTERSRAECLEILEEYFTMNLIGNKEEFSDAHNRARRYLESKRVERKNNGN